MKCILDTHFLLWLAVGDPRVDEFPWLDRYRPWGVSPVSFLEVQYLHEVGRLQVDIHAFASAVGNDDRFVVDEVALMNLMTQALPLSWTRDPFDRLLTAHSAARRAPLCTVDRTIRRHHASVVKEIGGLPGSI